MADRVFPATEALYDTDPYQTVFTAVVLGCEETADGQFLIVLDRTGFFPEQGGQSGDRGMLGAVNVLDTQVKAGVITHICDGALSAGETVEGRVDWERRFDFMQNHSGEHLFSGILHWQYGIRNCGFHLSDSVMTADYEQPLSDDVLAEVEEKCCRAVWEDLTVQISYPSEEEQQTLAYRSKKEVDGALRIVTFPGIDVCACCAPHVKRTGEIGLVKVVSAMHYKKGTRVTLACGEKAFAMLAEEHRLIKGLAVSFSTKESEVPAQVARLKEKNHELTGQLAEAKAQILSLEAEKLSGAEGPALLFGEDLPDAAMRRTVNGLMETREGLCGVFAKTDKGYRFVLGCAGGGMKEVAAKLRQMLHAGCGGDDRMASGSIPADEAAIREALS